MSDRDAQADKAAMTSAIADMVRTAPPRSGKRHDLMVGRDDMLVLTSDLRIDLADAQLADDAAPLLLRDPMPGTGFSLATPVAADADLPPAPDGDAPAPAEATSDDRIAGNGEAVLPGLDGDVLEAEGSPDRTGSPEFHAPQVATAGPADLSADGPAFDEAALRDVVAEMVREELQGAMGERVSRNVRKLVRREIMRAISVRDLD